MSKTIFWITNGIESHGNYRVIVSTDKDINCVHCFKTSKGFEALGNSDYQVCKSCIYNPSKDMIELGFIRVSRIKDGEEWQKFLDKCYNKEHYYKLIEVNKLSNDIENKCISCGGKVKPWYDIQTLGLRSNYHKRCARKNRMIR